MNHTFAIEETLWDVCGLFVGCLWVVCGLFVGCLWVVCGIFVGCLWVVFGLFVGFLGVVCERFVKVSKESLEKKADFNSLSDLRPVILLANGTLK